MINLKNKIIQRAGIAVATVAMGAAGTMAAAPAAHANPSTQVQAANSCPTWTVMGNGVNFRTGPGTSYRSIGLLYRFDYGTRVSSTRSWVKIKLSARSKTGMRAGTTAWVSKAYAYQCVYMN
ncbi:hypothetical protein AS594_00435 [Streptomyces agglomeratus]|uniref:SH3b domain-containing protein n=1 Tax=Streptomyces agglomeratus TaxID=285458 RepID=A0A1E5P0Z9_9ACTN|nr:SH3 domain-containing protein [Streptomyces agglomeratus]OEJ23210.1 hypothetical protein AS594_00435 [Streptomyces agglomeratus]